MVTLTDIERESYKNSPIHRLDPRVKLLCVLTIIIYVVSLPRIHEKNMARLFAIEVYLLLLVLAAEAADPWIIHGGRVWAAAQHGGLAAAQQRRQQHEGLRQLQRHAASLC